MFDIENFSKILQKISDSYSSISEFSEKSEVNRTYLSKYINKKLESPPSPEILKKLSSNSNGIVSYIELMEICGYAEEAIESTTYNIYRKMKKLNEKINKNINDSFQIKIAIEQFQIYSNDLIDSINNKNTKKLYLTNYYKKDYFIEDCNYVIMFLFLYESFIKRLIFKEYISIIDFIFTDWFDDNDLYNKLKNVIQLEHLTLLSSTNTSFKINENNLYNLTNFIKDFASCINLSYISNFDDNALIELFKKKINFSRETTKIINSSQYLMNENNKQFYMCPVYGKISAGQPNWAEECLDGYLPIDPNLMGIVNPEETFFLLVNGESMNKVIRNGAYALIRKQDVVENGEICAVLINGFEATLKKFSKQGDLVILEPMSNDSSFTTQVYNKDTQVKIIGKYIGKFEINK